MSPLRKLDLPLSGKTFEVTHNFRDRVFTIPPTPPDNRQDLWEIYLAGKLLGTVFAQGDRLFLRCGEEVIAGIFSRRLLWMDFWQFPLDHLLTKQRLAALEIPEPLWS